MKKHGVLLDMINNFIIFLPRYYIHSRALLFPVLTMPTIDNKIIPTATQKDLLSNQILKKGSTEKIDKFLKILEELSKKKRQLINIFKWKTSMAKLNHKIIVISTLENSKKENLPISILETKISKLNTKKVDLAIIGMDAYQTACKLKWA